MQTVVVVWSMTWVGGRCVVDDTDGWSLLSRWWLTTQTVVVAITMAMVVVGSHWIAVVVAICWCCGSGGGVRCMVDTIRKCL